MSMFPYRTWEIARYLGAGVEDTPLTEYDVAEFTISVAERCVQASPITAILLRAFGTDAQNETASLMISGFMAAPTEKRNNPGPGFRLWSGVLTTGNRQYTTRPHPKFEALSGGAKWFEVDTWDTTAGFTRVTTQELGAADNEKILVLPTLGFTHILFELFNKDGVTGSEMSRCGILWRPAILDEVVLDVAGT